MSLLWEVTNQFGGCLYPTFWSGYGGIYNPAGLGAPVAAGMTGISVSAGLNVISAIQEVGIAVAVEPVAAVMDYSEFETV